MTVFVAGASGQLGRRIADALPGQLQVRRVSTSAAEAALRLDLRRPSGFDYRQIERGDVVVLTAAISSPDRCAREHELAYAVNVTGTGEAIEAILKRGARVIFTSSDVVLGNRRDEVFEDAERRPVGPYAEMKAEIERRFAGEPNVSILRLSYVVSGVDPFLAYLRTCAAEGRTAQVFDSLERRTVALEDVIAATAALCAGRPAQPGVINLAGPDLLSRRAMADIYADRVDARLRIETIEAPEGFFEARPQVINMGSHRLAPLLGRPPRPMTDTIGRLASTDASLSAA